MKKLKKTLEKVQDKGLLILESPMYPFVYLFLTHILKNETLRKKFYLQTKGFIPFRRLFFYILDKLFEKECNHFKNPSYEGRAGYILDLKYALAHNFFNKKIYNNNYQYCFSDLESLVTSDASEYLIIDFGCGAGVMTRQIKEKYSEATVIGLDIRKETMEYNSFLYATIKWGMVSDIDSYIRDLRGKKIIVVCNGVINFMTFIELQNLLNKNIDSFIWFYFTAYADPMKEYIREDDILSLKHNDVDYNMPRILKRNNYTFNYELVPLEEGVGNFIHGSSHRHNTLL